VTQSDGGYPNQPPPYPGQPYPGQPYPGQPYPSQPYPGQPSTGQPYPGQPSTGQPGPAPYPGAPSPTYPGQPGYPSQPYPGQPATGQPYPSTAPTQAFPTQVTQPPYGYQYPQPTPPKNKALPALLIGGIVVVVLVAVVGVGALVIATARNKNNPGTLGPTGTSTESPTASPTSVAFNGDLRTLLVALPAGSTKDPNDGNGGTDGTVTLEQAAQTYTDPDFGKTHMQALGYQQGATVSWHEANKYSVQIVLFQFQQPRFAADFIQKLEDGLDGDNSWETRADLDGIPTGRFYVSAQTNKNGNYNFEIWFDKGGIAARMDAFGPNKTDVEKLKTVAQKQFAMLP
jgi:hypothetical protein